MIEKGGFFMKFEDIKQTVFDAASELGLTEYELFYTSDSSVSAETLKNEISAFAYGVSGGACFRCVVDGKMGSASSELITPEEMRAIVKRAEANARIIESDDPAIIFEGSSSYEKTNMPEIKIPGAAEIKEKALKMQENTYGVSELVTDGTQSYVFSGESEFRLINSKGLDLENKYKTVGAYVQAVINRDGESEESFESTDKLDDDTTLALSKKAVDGAIAKLGAKEVESGKYDVIFSSKQTRALLSTFSSVFSGRSAQLGLSLLAGKEGQKIASDCVTIVDDPRREGCAAQTSFDGEGVATYRKTVIENGVLNTLLYDLTSAMKAGRESTANGQRSVYAEPVTIAPYSFYIEGGKKTFEELCATVKDGIYITALKGLHAGANAVTGDFSIDSEGFRIRDGKIAEAVKSFTVAGNFFELLKSVEDISSEVTFGLPSCFTSYGAPEILVRNMSIAGK